MAKCCVGTHVAARVRLPQCRNWHDKTCVCKSLFSESDRFQSKKGSFSESTEKKPSAAEHRNIAKRYNFSITVGTFELLFSESTELKRNMWFFSITSRYFRITDIAERYRSIAKYVFFFDYSPYFRITDKAKGTELKRNMWFILIRYNHMI